MTRPRVSAIRPYLTEVRLDCPRVVCGNDEVTVELNESTGEYTPEESCFACNVDAGAVVPFEQAERLVLIERAKDAVDNYEPTDRELEASRVDGFPTVAEQLDAARRLK